MRDSPLLTLFLVLAPFSLTAFGGGISVVTGIQYQAVEVHGWLTSEEFLRFFAISRAAPGPGSLFTSLIGWHVAGLPGALVATVAMFLPSSLLCAAVAVIWKRFRGSRWLLTLEEAVAPLGIALLVAALITLMPLAGSTIPLMVIAAVACLIVALKPSIHPLVLLALGAIGNAAFGTTFL